MKNNYQILRSFQTMSEIISKLQLSYTFQVSKFYNFYLACSKGESKGINSPCLFNLYEEYIMRNTRVDEAQTGIKIPGRNINNINMQMIPL